MTEKADRFISSTPWVVEMHLRSKARDEEYAEAKERNEAAQNRAIRTGTRHLHLNYTQRLPLVLERWEA